MKTSEARREKGPDDNKGRRCWTTRPVSDPKELRSSNAGERKMRGWKQNGKVDLLGGEYDPVSFPALGIMTANCIVSKISRPAKAMLGDP